MKQKGRSACGLFLLSRAVIKGEDFARKKGRKIKHVKKMQRIPILSWVVTFAKLFDERLAVRANRLFFLYCSQSKKCQKKKQHLQKCDSSCTLVFTHEILLQNILSTTTGMQCHARIKILYRKKLFEHLRLRICHCFTSYFSLIILVGE